MGQFDGVPENNKSEEIEKKEINILSQEEYDKKLQEIQKEDELSRGYRVRSNGLKSVESMTDEGMMTLFLKMSKFKSENMTEEMFKQYKEKENYSKMYPNCKDLTQDKN